MEIYEIRQYTDREGKLVTARITINAKTLVPFNAGEGDIKFFGTYTIPTPHGIMRVEFEFPNEFTLEQCFINFQKEAENHFQKLQEESKKEANTPKIWTPGGEGNEKSKSGLFIPK